MNLHNGDLFWPTTYTNEPQYPVLEENINCDCLIVGGGMSGALCAYLLSKETEFECSFNRQKIPWLRKFIC